MAQPQWITPAGDLGTIPEGIFYQQTLTADTPVIATVTVTAASSTTNRFTCNSTANIYAGLNVIFSAENLALIGGVRSNIRYFVFEVYNSTEFSICATEFSTTVIPLTNGVGNMTGEFTQHVLYYLIAGQLPEGVQVSDNGLIEGTPKAVASLQGTPAEVAFDVTSKFAIRAYTRTRAGSVDRINDRTFSLTVTGQDVPEFVTPPGNIGTFYDGDPVDIQIEFSDPDPDEDIVIRVLTGELPPGLTVDPHTGLISGVIEPLVGPPSTAEPGYDATAWDEYPYDFGRRSASKNFQFGLEITDGKDNNVRVFEIFVYSKDSMSADTTDFTADNTFITADVVPTRTPVLLTPPGDLGIVRADNFYAFKFDGIDFDGDAIEYSVTVGAGIGFDNDGFDITGFDRGSFSLPPGLAINPETGWFYGYIPDQGATIQTYRFAVRVLKANQPSIISGFYYFTITITGNADTEVNWITEPDLGTILNGAISTLSVEAVNVGGRALSYRLESGSDSKLPQGLTLQPTGHITGRVSFNTFALDGGTTTFDTNLNTRLGILETTFDLSFSFTVNAYSAEAEQLGYQVGSIVISSGGSGYTSQPTITIGAPPNTESAVQATAGVATIVDGRITSIAIGNPGRGYSSPPIITISGGGGSGAEAVIILTESQATNAVSVFRRFTVTVDRYFNEPYERLYIKAMPPEEDRALINQLIQNQDIIPQNVVYRSDDPNFGVAKYVVYDHAYGLNSATIEQYVSSLDINHYWKNITLGPIRTAQALRPDGTVLYEVVYSEIIDDLVNAQGESVSKAVTLPYPINEGDSTEIDTVYPNSLINMRDQVVATVGQIAPPLIPVLPLWMTSKQTNGRVLGFTPAWVIAYVNPGESGRVAYNIQEQFGDQLNVVDFKIDRYELDRSQTHNWDPSSNEWIPQPPAATTFDKFRRPSGLRDLGFVDYATTLAFSEINWRPMDEIAALGGIDGVIGRQINNRTVIFVQQENFGEELSDDEAFTDYDPPFDLADVNSGSGSYDHDLYDEAVVLSNARRLAIYRFRVLDNNQVTLEWVQDVTTNDFVQVRFGDTFASDQLYIPAAPTPGLTRVTWSYIPEPPSEETVFDAGSTRFINIADRWTSTDAFDKYLVFPRTNILN